MYQCAPLVGLSQAQDVGDDAAELISVASVTLGIDRCGLCSAAESAIPVIPGGHLAIVSNGGAAGLGDRGCARSTA